MIRSSQFTFPPNIPEPKCLAEDKLIKVHAK